jgi:hypothetical protein
MLSLTIPATELWDERKKEFVYVEEQTLELEHSLVSLSKWESKWCKSFIETKNKTSEEALDYIKCMTLTKNVKPEVFQCFTPEHIRQILEYVDAPMTATTIRESKTNKRNRERITAELIYHWMVEMQIPFECEEWHLSRLIMFIRVRQHKLQPPKKRSRAEVMADYAAMNEARKKEWNTNG